MNLGGILAIVFDSVALLVTAVSIILISVIAVLVKNRRSNNSTKRFTYNMEAYDAETKLVSKEKFIIERVAQCIAAPKLSGALAILSNLTLLLYRLICLMFGIGSLCTCECIIAYLMALLSVFYCTFFTLLTLLFFFAYFFMVLFPLFAHSALPHYCLLLWQ